LRWVSTIAGFGLMDLRTQTKGPCTRQRRSDTISSGSDKAPRSSAGALNSLGPVFSFQLAYQIATLRQINWQKADDSRAEGEP
jgi:hypothetical protein